MMSNLVNMCLTRNVWTNASKALIGRQLLSIGRSRGALFGCKRLMQTSEGKKGGDSHSGDHSGGIPSYVPGLMDPQPKGPQTVGEFADVESQKNWVSYGFDIGNRDEDRLLLKGFFFVIITVGTVLIPYIMLYYPDYKLLDWSVREAYLELDRRERLGLPLVDKNLVDPNVLQLPSDEELADTEIYI